MKTFNNLYPILCDMSTLRTAFADGIRRKTHDREVLAFKNTDGSICWEKATPFLEGIASELVEGTYHPSTPRHRKRYCTNKSSKTGKWRDTYHACLKDHVVQHAVVLACRAPFRRGMYAHSVGCIEGRGIHHIVRYVSRWLRRDHNSQYFVKLDIRRQYDSTDPTRLKARMRRLIRDRRMLALIDEIIDSTPYALATGYYTSPWFSEVFLQPLDHYITQHLYKVRRGKRVSYVRHYLRNVDDMLLIGTSKSDLKKAVRSIKRFAREELGLTVKDSWEVKKIAAYDGSRLIGGTHRIDIGGYRFDRRSVTLRPGIYLSTMRLARRIKKRREERGEYIVRDCRSYMSKRGWASHTDCESVKSAMDRAVSHRAVKEVISHYDKRSHRNASRNDHRACQG